MSAYEDAPATKLLASHCAVCARPLVDSVSVEAGIGPDCRAKYGYGEAQGEADFDRAMFALGLHDCLPSSFLGHDVDDLRTSPKRFANLLVHRIACGSELVRGRYVVALAALGFDRLARRIAERIGAVEVTREGDDLVVRTTRRLEDDAFAAFLGATRGFGRWDRERKARVVPVEKRLALWAVLRSELRPGTVVLGERLAVI